MKGTFTGSDAKVPGRIPAGDLLELRGEAATQAFFFISSPQQVKTHSF